MPAKPAILALSAALALAACKDDDDKANTNTTSESTVTAEVTAPAEPDNTMQITAWDEQYVVDLKDIEVVVPDNRLFQMDATAFCPSLSGSVETLEEYTAQCHDLTEAKAQYIVDVYACRGHGDTFYAAIPSNTSEVAIIFSTETNIEEYDPARLFTVDGMRRQFERYGNDNFTVTKATNVGAPAEPYDVAAAMQGYIAEGRGNHQTQDPMCPTQFVHNIK